MSIGNFQTVQMAAEYETRKLNQHQFGDPLIGDSVAFTCDLSAGSENGVV